MRLSTGSLPAARLTGVEAAHLKGAELSRLKGAKAPRPKGAEAPRLKGDEAASVAHPLPVMIGHYDRELRCSFGNDEYFRWLNRSADEMIGMNMADLLDPALFALNAPHIAQVLRGAPQIFERAMQQPGGQVSHVIVNYLPSSTGNDVVGFFELVTDITAVKVKEAELQMASLVYQNTVEAIIVSDVQGVILSVNPAFTAITGYQAAEAIGRSRTLFLAERLDEAYRPDPAGGAPRATWRGDVWLRRRNGERFLASKTVSSMAGAGGAGLRFLTVFNDATELVLKNERLRHLALYDALTNLPNRYFLLERLQHLCDLGAREARRTAVLFIDLDGFKDVNDRLGHKGGDMVLIEAAGRLRAAVRQTDTVARLGGDEFVVLLCNPASQARVVQITRRILRALAVPMPVLGQRVEVGGSIGIALGPQDGDTPVALLEYADAAMYMAKAAGRGTFRFHGGLWPVPRAQSHERQAAPAGKTGT
jgi:diguanylate cyclase (GGDEF)-like protein/PAS domain S-box-containing protein